MKINLSIGGVGAFYETPQILETTSRALYSSRMINFQERKKKMVLKAPFFIRSLLASLNQVSFVLGLLFKTKLPATRTSAPASTNCFAFY
jgi:hypothetical protein